MRNAEELFPRRRALPRAFSTIQTHHQAVIRSLACNNQPSLSYVQFSGAILGIILTTGEAEHSYSKESFILPYSRSLQALYMQEDEI
jgi:hypothetical protein